MTTTDTTTNDVTTPRRDGPPGPEEGWTPRAHRSWIWFFLIVIGAAGVAFFFKLKEFFYDLTVTPGFEFTGAHLLIYLLVASGFFLLLTFAFLRGHFADIESPKIDLLDLERSYDRAEFEDR